jgi:hypothetical protein
MVRSKALRREILRELQVKLHVNELKQKQKSMQNMLWLIEVELLGLETVRLYGVRDVGEFWVEFLYRCYDVVNALLKVHYLADFRKPDRKQVADYHFGRT